MIVCLRTVGIPADVRSRYLDWIVLGPANQPDRYLVQEDTP
jgi:hypothetical protein